MAFPSKGEEDMKGMPEALQNGRQRDNLLWQSIGKKHENKSNRGKKSAQNLDLKLQISDQEHTDDYPSKKRQGFIKIGDRGMPRLRIPCDQGQGVRDKSDQNGCQGCFGEIFLQKNDVRGISQCP